MDQKDIVPVIYKASGCVYNFHSPAVTFGRQAIGRVDYLDIEQAENKYYPDKNNKCPNKIFSVDKLIHFYFLNTKYWLKVMSKTENIELRIILKTMWNKSCIRNISVRNNTVWCANTKIKEYCKNHINP